MKENIVWGILSTAEINEAVIPGIRGAGRSELRAVASRSLERAKAYAADKKVPVAYGSYEELLKDSEIDAVYLPVPNNLHAEWAEKAADAGKHVLCEKPLVLTLEDMDRVTEAAERNKVTVFEAFMYQHHPQMKKVRELIAGGKIGSLQFIDAWFDYYLPEEDESNIRLNPGMGGGSLWDVGVYPNSLVVTLADAGPPVEILCRQKTGQNGVDVSAYAQMRFSNDITAQISTSIRAPLRVGAQIVGDRGTLVLAKPWKPGFLYLPGNDTREVHISFTGSDGTVERYDLPVIDTYQTEIETMEACILDGEPPVIPLHKSRWFLESMLGLRRSAAEEKPVRLNQG
jgi:predicted dehydrogenase